MRYSILMVGAMLGILVACAQKNKSKNTKNMSKDTQSIAISDTSGVALFGNGCFWCTEAIFQQLKGVKKVTSGYSGGHVENPSYEEVCRKTTGHAEAIKIEYDPSLISYDKLLEVFWKTHDPTTLNRQGNDVGPQYRSVIFFLTPEQQEKAQHYKTELDKSGAWPNPIVTAIEPYKNFYPAEDYHQNYYKLNGREPYCYFVIRPKMEKFREAFKDIIAE